MMFKLRKLVTNFIDSKEQSPLISAVGAGLYPLLYYYNTNFTLVNSWSQFMFFLISFILIPIIAFILIYRVFSKLPFTKRLAKYIIPVLNLTTFSFFVVLITYGFKNELSFVFVFAALVLAVVFYKHIKKLIVFQFLLAAFCFVRLVPDFHKYMTYSDEWLEQPDNIEEVTFKKTPNIYLIQPDGYANFSELRRGYYNYDNSNFESFLEKEDFKLYNNYRSNYVSTLSSNSSMFAMKHHYYDNTLGNSKELFNTRQIIVGQNPVISILKNNNYKSFLLLEKSYLLVNRPKIKYDYCNIDFKEISPLARGFEINKEIIEDLDNRITNNKDSSNFYFICIKRPSHISVNKNESIGVDKERERYLNELEKSNKTLKEIINVIKEKDDNSLIIIAADHGGYVGLNYSMQYGQKQTERDIVYSIFTSTLAIKWPNNKPPHFDNKLKSPVNLFRVLISYLSDNENYLKYLEANKSYTLLRDGEYTGVYEYIDENGNVQFKKHEQ